MRKILVLVLMVLSGCGAIVADMMPSAKYYTEEVVHDLQFGQVKNLEITTRHGLLVEPMGYEGGLLYLLNELFLPLPSARYFYVSFSIYGESGCAAVDLLKNAFQDHADKLGKWAVSDYCRGPHIYEGGLFNKLQDKHLASFWHKTAGLQEVKIIRKVETIGLKEKPDLPVEIRIRTTEGKSFLDFVLQTLRLDLSGASLKTYKEAFGVPPQASQ